MLRAAASPSIQMALSRPTGFVFAAPPGPAPGFMTPEGTNPPESRQKQSRAPWLLLAECMRKAMTWRPAARSSLPTFAHAMKRRSSLLSAAMFIRPRRPRVMSMSAHSPVSRRYDSFVPTGLARTQRA